MGLFGLFKAKPFVVTTELSDPQLRAAAELIDDRVGKQGDRIVTSKDIEKTRAMLKKHDEYVAKGKNEKSPLASMMLTEIDVVRTAIDRLEAALHGEKPKVGNRPFCTSLSVDTIHDKAAKKTAAFLAANFGNGAAQLNLKEVDDVRELLEARASGATLTPAQQALATKLDAATAAGEFSVAAFHNIELFMFTGKGGLVQHGPVYITGKKFDDVYKLPVPEGFDWKDTKKVSDLLDDYERRFKECGFDRIYVKSDAGELFVALNPKGRLKRVADDYRAQFKDDGALKDSGDVLRAVDVDNSFTEAVFGFWGKLVHRLVSSIRGRFTNDETSKAIKDAADKVSDAPKGEQLKQMLVAGSVVAGMGVATINVPVAVGIAAVASVGVTAANVFEMARIGKDKLPVLNAAGITVNRDETISH